MSADTSAEAVRRLVVALENGGVWSTGMQLAAATLRALLAERDDARMCADVEAAAANEFKAERDEADAERDAAKADLLACVKQVAAEGRLRGTAEAERDALAAERDRLAAEVASLRLTLGGKTFSAEVPEPIGCPLPGACATVAEIVRGREVQAAWLRVIQAENTCGVTGKPCDAVRCGCAAEQEMLIREAGEGRGDG